MFILLTQAHTRQGCLAIMLQDLDLTETTSNTVGIRVKQMLAMTFEGALHRRLCGWYQSTQMRLRRCIVTRWLVATEYVIVRVHTQSGFRSLRSIGTVSACGVPPHAAKH